MRVLVACAAVAMLCGCALLEAGTDTALSQPVYAPGPVAADGTPGAPVAVIDADGTYRTVGEQLADQIESTGAAAGSTAGGILGGPLAPIGGVAGALLAAAGASRLRSRHRGAVAAAAGTQASSAQGSTGAS